MVWFVAGSSSFWKRELKSCSFFICTKEGGEAWVMKDEAIVGIGLE